ncbi:MAG: DUF5683 domain-containing protein [Endomicrobium sp.]|jgi:hypothetical protein|nr:DUF5683 domain-containing protein [Endomicrobium sp.]
MKNIIVFILIIILLLGINSYASVFTIDVSENTSDYSALRSALIPGWGQAYNKQPIKAWIIFGLFAASVGGSLYFNNEASKKYDKYKDLGLIDSNYYDDYKRDVNISNICITPAVLFWLYGIIDAYFTSKSISGSKSVSSFNVSYNPEKNRLGMNYKYRI